MPGRLREGPGEINAARAPEEGAVRVALDGLRAGLIADGGNVELVKVDEDGTVVVELQGACRTCPAQAETLELVIEARLRHAFPGITAVVAI